MLNTVNNFRKSPKLAAVNLFSRCCRVLWQYFVKRRSVSLLWSKCCFSRVSSFRSATAPSPPSDFLLSVFSLYSLASRVTANIVLTECTVHTVTYRPASWPIRVHVLYQPYNKLSYSLLTVIWIFSAMLRNSSDSLLFKSSLKCSLVRFRWTM